MYQEIEEKGKKTLGIYIHIPFCKKKCNYCDFISFCNKDKLIPEYMKWLNYEIKDVANNLQVNGDEVIINTIYIGGGTPSHINPLYIQEIMNNIKLNYNVSDNAEITIEVNPGTITEEKLIVYKDCGINRLSIGLQATQDNLLKQLGRIHTYNEFKETYTIARKVGFENINIDLMIGLPNQSIEDVEETLAKILLANPEHISVYSLIVEEETALANDIIGNKYKLPPEELEREMYWLVKETLEKNGYKHYEISNFSKRGYESRHNLDCWEQEEYFGFGVNAHSFMDNIRFSNTENIEEYIRNYKKKEQNSNFIFHEKLDYLNKMKEYVMLGFRKIDGINKNDFEDKFKVDIYRIFEEELNALINVELIEDIDGYIRLTKMGLDLANQVFEKICNIM